MNHVRSISESFTELAVRGCIGTIDVRKHGNIIKASASHEEAGDIEPAGHQQADTAEPEIIIHRDGEVITRIEFVCPCGKKAEIQFDYAKD